MTSQDTVLTDLSSEFIQISRYLVENSNFKLAEIVYNVRHYHYFTQLSTVSHVSLSWPHVKEKNKLRYVLDIISKGIRAEWKLVMKATTHIPNKMSKIISSEILTVTEMNEAIAIIVTQYNLNNTSEISNSSGQSKKNKDFVNLTLRKGIAQLKDKYEAYMKDSYYQHMFQREPKYATQCPGIATAVSREDYKTMAQRNSESDLSEALSDLRSVQSLGSYYSNSSEADYLDGYIYKPCCFDTLDDTIISACFNDPIEHENFIANESKYSCKNFSWSDDNIPSFAQSCDIDDVMVDDQREGKFKLFLSSVRSRATELGDKIDTNVSELKIKANETMHEVQDKLDVAAQEHKQNIANMTDAIGHNTQVFKENASVKAKDIKDHISSTLTSIADRIHASIVQPVHDAYRSVIDTVKSKVMFLTLVLGAVLACVVLGAGYVLSKYLDMFSLVLATIAAISSVVLVVKVKELVDKLTKYNSVTMKQSGDDDDITDNDYSMFTDSVSSFASDMCSICCVIFNPLKKDMSFSGVEKYFRGFNSIVTNFKGFGTTIFKLLETVINVVRIKVFNMDKIYLTSSGVAQLDAYRKEVDCIYIKNRSINYERTLSELLRLRTIITQLELIKYNARGQDAARISTLVNDTLLTVRKILPAYETMPFNLPGLRPTPVGIAIQGLPKSGKTGCMRFLIEHIAEISKNPEIKSQFAEGYASLVWSMPAAEEFDSGYISQRIIVNDDFMAMREVIGSVSCASKSINWLTDMPVSTNQASEPLKGKVFLEALLMMCSMNDMGPLDSVTVKHAEALDRRFERFEVMLNKKYSKMSEEYGHEVLDTDKIAATGGGFRYDAVFYRSAATQKIYNFFEFARYICARVDANVKICEDNKKSSKIRSDYVLKCKDAGTEPTDLGHLDAEIQDTICMDTSEVDLVFPTVRAAASNSVGRYGCATSITKLEHRLNAKAPAMCQSASMYEDEYSRMLTKQRDFVPCIDIEPVYNPFISDSTKICRDPFLQTENIPYVLQAYMSECSIHDLLCNEIDFTNTPALIDSDKIGLYKAIHCRMPFKGDFKEFEALSEDSKLGLALYCEYLLRKDKPFVDSIMSVNEKINYMRREFVSKFHAPDHQTMLTAASLAAVIATFIGIGVCAYKYWSGPSPDEVKQQVSNPTGRGYNKENKKVGRVKYANDEKFRETHEYKNTRFQSGTCDVDTTNDAMIASLCAKMRKRLCVVEVLVGDKWKKLGYALQVFDNVCVMPDHFMCDGDTSYRFSRGDKFYIVNELNEGYKNFGAYLSVKGKEGDFCFINVEGLPKMKSWGKFFIKAADTNRLPRSVFSMYVQDFNTTSCLHTGEGCIVDQHDVDYVSKSRAQCLKNYMSGVSTSTVVKRSVKSNMVNAQGYCGSPVMLNNLSMGSRRLCGIHIAGNGGTESYACVVTQEDIEDAITQFNVNVSCDTDDVPEEFVIGQSGDTGGELCRAPRIGVNPIRVNTPNKTKMRPTHFQKLCPPIMAPRFLNKMPNTGICVHDIAEDHYAKPTEPIMEEGMWEAAAVSFFQRLEDTNHKGYTPEQRVILSVDEVIEGDVNTKYYDSPNRSTSLGYPLSQTWGMYYPGKTSVLSADGPVLLNGPHSAEFRVMVDDMARNLKNSDWNEVLIVDCMKDEVGPIEKVMAGKTRLFSNCPYAFNVVTNQYFGAFVTDIMLNHCLNNIAVGMNVYSDWDVMARQMQAMGPHMLGGDYSKFDAHHKVFCFQMLAKYINRWYGDDEYSQDRINIMNILCHSKHIWDNQIYQLDHSLPSGSYLTTIINSLINCINVVAVYIKLYASRNDAFSDYVSMGNECFEYVNFLVFGDDMIASVSDLRPEFNQQTVAIILKESYGYDWTIETKGESDVLYRKLNEVQFLKRSIIWNSATRCYVAALDVESIIHKMLMWQVKSVDMRTAMLQTIDSALNELSLHPYHVFIKWLEPILKIAYSKYNYVPVTRKYEELAHRCLSQDCFL